LFREAPLHLSDASLQVIHFLMMLVSDPGDTPLDFVFDVLLLIHVCFLAYKVVDSIPHYISFSEEKLQATLNDFVAFPISAYRGPLGYDLREEKMAAKCSPLNHPIHIFKVVVVTAEPNPLLVVTGKTYTGQAPTEKPVEGFRQTLVSVNRG
jgi:hypothetical protein